MRSLAVAAAFVLALALPLAAEDATGPLADLTFDNGQAVQLADLTGQVVALIPVCKS